MKLASRSQVPPGLFRFRHPISGHEMSRHAWDLLRSDVTAHTTANNYPEVTDDEIESQMCERMGNKIAAQYCGDGNGLSVNGITLGWRDILQGTQAMASFIIAGRPLVDQGEAERRAAICATCPRNVGFSKPCDGICGELQKVVESIVGAGGTSLDGKLESCSVCKCHLKSKVWIPLEILRKSDAPEHQGQYPDFCWQKA